MENLLRNKIIEYVRKDPLCIDDISNENGKELIYRGHLKENIGLAGSIHGFYLHIAFDEERFCGSFILDNGRLRYFLGDIESYVFLPKENKVVPKAISVGIPKSRKIRADITNCYTLIDASLSREELSEYIILLLEKDEP